MISTLLNYRLYAQDMTRSLARIEADAAVSRDAQYYADNIGNVRSVDDLLGDQRLYAYAMKAYGLGDQVGSRALIRQVLESDLSDTGSFANRLTDQRYRQLAAAFDFSAASAEPTLQSQAQTDRLVEAYSEHLVRGGALASEKVSAFESRLAGIRDVDQFLADPVLFEVTAKLLNLDPATASRTYVRGVLLAGSQGSGQSEAQSFLAGAFRFDADGTVQTGGGVMAADKQAQLVTRYFTAVGQGSSSQAVAYQARYFEERVASITSAAELVNDPTLLAVLRSAFDLSDAPKEQLQNVLVAREGTGHPLDGLPERTEAQKAQKAKLVALNAAFSFDSAGNAVRGEAIQPGALGQLVDDFYVARPPTETALITLRTNSFRVQLTKMDSINDLLGRDPVYGRAAFEYILKAFDLDPAIESSSKIRRVLQSDPSDPNSFVRKLGDVRYEKLAAAFNFDVDGKVRNERLVQSVREQQEVASLYAKSFGDDPGSERAARTRAETVSYLEAVGGITSLDALLSNRTVLDFALKAHGLEDEKLGVDQLRRLLTSDLTDPESYARSLGDRRYLDFADSFNIDPTGRIPTATGNAQSETSFLSTQNLYLLQMMEERAGESSEGTRLALYFLRKSPDIRNAFSILGDKALFEVARTALGLPESMSQLDIDRQASILETRLDFSEFKDPEALDRFISRFTVLYDMNNASTQQFSPVLALFGGAQSGASGILGVL